MQLIVGLSAVIISTVDFVPSVLVTEEEGGDVLPFGLFNPESHDTLEKGLRGWVETQTGLTLAYVEQLYTFGNKSRHTFPDRPDARVLSIGYLALTRRAPHVQAVWRSWYDYFPWEDARDGTHPLVTENILPALKNWAGTDAQKKARVHTCFEEWDDERVLERYELLYEARLVQEALRDRNLKGTPVPSRPMRHDHRRILATAMGRLRGKLKYRPVVYELMTPEFTLFDLQRTVEAISGHKLHKQNFRRMVEASGLIEEVAGRKATHAGGRPAALFRFISSSSAL